MSALRSLILQPKIAQWAVVLGGVAFLFVGIPIVLRQTPTLLFVLLPVPLLGAALYSHLESGTRLLLVLAPVAVVIADFFPDSRLTAVRDVALVAIALFWAFRQYLHGNLHLPGRFLGAATRPMVLLGLSIFGGIAVGLLERSSLQVMFGLKVLALYVPLAVIIAAQVKTDQDALKVGRAIVLAAVWASGYLVFKFLAPPDLYPEYDAGFRNIGSDAFGRLYSSDLLRLNALALPMIGTLSLLEGRTIIKRIMYALAFVFLIALLIVGSKRIVIIATVIGLLVVLRFVKRWTPALLLACSIGVALWFLPERGYERWTGLLEGQDESAETRVEELQSFWVPFVISHPMGTGIGTFSAVSASSAAWADIGQGFGTVSAGAVKYSSVHNGFLLVYAELGLVGLASFLWLLWSVAMGCVRAVRTSTSPALRAAGVGVLGALVALMVHEQAASGIISFPMSFYLWAVCGLGIAVSRIATETAGRGGT